jgi:nucleoside-diphosphate-sugar epimerase
MKPVLIVGCGYVGSEVARRLLKDGVKVYATTRDTDRLREVEALGAKIIHLDVSETQPDTAWIGKVPEGFRVLLSVPTLKSTAGFVDPTPRIVEMLGDHPSRVVYLSTTGVYGSINEVDAETPAAPETERQHWRVEAEQAVAKGPWPSLILRPSAIYGPFRGVHRALLEGRYRLVGSGDNFVSRIHRDDVAWHSIEALASDLTGAYPVADEEPCTSRQIAEFCARKMKLPMPESVTAAEVDETRRTDRRVDGSFIREELGVDLYYSSYRIGIPASMLAEQWETPSR